MILALCVNFIHGFDVTCDNALNEFSKFDDICYVKQIPTEAKEKINFVLSYNTPDKITTVDIYTKDNELGINYIPTEVFDFFPNLNALRVNSKVSAISSDDLRKGEKLTSLRVSSELQKISKGTFSANVNLQFLSFYSNKISVIEDNAFEGLSKLFSLDLQNNELKIIHRKTFSGLDELHVLNLYSNQIETIEDFSFEHLTKLEHLTLHRNNLKILSDNAFAGLGNLQDITLQNNGLTRVNNALYGLVSIEKIDLTSNNITDVDLKRLFDLPKLPNVSIY